MQPRPRTRLGGEGGLEFGGPVRSHCSHKPMDGPGSWRKVPHRDHCGPCRVVSPPSGPCHRGFNLVTSILDEPTSLLRGGRSIHEHRKVTPRTPYLPYGPPRWILVTRLHHADLLVYLSDRTSPRGSPGGPHCMGLLCGSPVWTSTRGKSATRPVICHHDLHLHAGSDTSVNLAPHSPAHRHARDSSLCGSIYIETRMPNEG